ncbi:MAG TPA: hypothetical protein ENL20_11070 [Candidatus Cloacimonetes bacterium]|nr:hypothetical protein [Candidatus Cloacimonadota bacterium]
MNISNKLEIAKEAIKLEINGRSFFRKAAEMTRSKLGKKMFEKLANDELRHLSDFKEIFSPIVGSEDWDRLVKEENSKGMAPVIKDLLHNLEKGDRSSELEAIKVGMELERKAIVFFSDIIKQLEDTQTKEIVGKIREEEKFHYDLLQAEYDSVTNSGFWLDVSEFKMDARF